MMKPRKFHTNSLTRVASERTRARKPSDRFVLFWLCQHSNPQLIVWPSIATIVSHTGLSASTVNRSLKVLRDLGEIVPFVPKPGQFGSFGRSSHYHLKVADVGWSMSSSDAVTMAELGSNRVSTIVSNETISTVTMTDKYKGTDEQSGADACADVFFENFKEKLASLDPRFAANWLRRIASVEIIDDTLVVTATEPFYAAQFRDQHAALIEGAAKSAGASFSRFESKHIGEARP